MSLLKATETYISYLIRAGESSSEQLDPDLFSAIWSKDCEKSINDNRLYEGGENFLTQL